MSYQTPSSFDQNRKSYERTTFCWQFYVETLSYYWSNANIALTTGAIQTIQTKLILA
jgi:hypothetical protein